MVHLYFLTVVLNDNGNFVLISLTRSTAGAHYSFVVLSCAAPITFLADDALFSHIVTPVQDCISQGHSSLAFHFHTSIHLYTAGADPGFV